MSVTSESDTTLSERVVQAIADAEGVDPVALRPPLHDVVDPEALDALFGPKSNGQPRQGGEISFEYRGYRVFVSGSETVSVEAR